MPSWGDDFHDRPMPLPYLFWMESAAAAQNQAKRASTKRSRRTTTQIQRSSALDSKRVSTRFLDVAGLFAMLLFAGIVLGVIR